MEYVEPPSIEPALIKIRRAAQITLPKEICQAAHFEEGHYLEAQLTKEGVLLCPVNITRREPTAEQEADILSAVDEARKNCAEERSGKR